MTPAHVPVDARWLLLIHQIPPKPDYLRVKIGRRLQQVGAVAVKNSVYVLPDIDTAQEHFQWIRSEILDGDGDAFVCRAEFIDGLTSDQIRHLFRSARNVDYAEIAATARALWRAPPRSGGDTTTPRMRADDQIARLRKRFATVAAIDFFGAPERVMAQEALDLLAAALTPPPAAPTPAATAPAPAAHDAAHRNRTWVTREGVFVDRMASAWLIRRFIDPGARFKFVRDAGYRPARGELRFDMFGGEFTHVGDACTFEVLLDRFELGEPALRTLAEVVHDIDLKDGKFARDDAPGIERVLAGIAAAHADDAARVERAGELFDELRALFASEAAGDPRASVGSSRRE